MYFWQAMFHRHQVEFNYKVIMLKKGFALSNCIFYFWFFCICALMKTEVFCALSAPFILSYFTSGKRVGLITFWDCFTEYSFLAFWNAVCKLLVLHICPHWRIHKHTSYVCVYYIYNTYSTKLKAYLLGDTILLIYWQSILSFSCFFMDVQKLHILQNLCVPIH